MLVIYMAISFMNSCLLHMSKRNCWNTQRLQNEQDKTWSLIGHHRKSHECGKMTQGPEAQDAKLITAYWWTKVVFWPSNTYNHNIQQETFPRVLSPSVMFLIRKHKLTVSGRQNTEGVLIKRQMNWYWSKRAILE